MVADDDVFVDMCEAAVNLCRTSAAARRAPSSTCTSRPGAFLGSAARSNFVTEGVTGVSVPGRSYVGMGIPLYNVHEVREFFGKVQRHRRVRPRRAIDDYDKHVIAAHAAENPDEGFKPTSGRSSGSSCSL